MDNFIFSTGKLSIADFDAPDYEDTDVVPALQSADFEPKCDIKTVREAASINMYPVADAQHNWQAPLKVNFAGFAEALIPYCTGATKSTSGSNNIYTHGGVKKPKYVKIKIEGELSDGRAATLEIFRAKAPGLPMNFKIDDFVMPSLEFTCLPVPGSDAWALTIAQS